jgi:hypothetical protein
MLKVFIHRIDECDNVQQVSLPFSAFPLIMNEKVIFFSHW